MMNLKSLKTHLKLKRVKARGFTLIELLVAIVITALMLTLVMASYWTFLQTQQRMAVSRELQSEVRFALNRMADKIRASRINYEAYLDTIPTPPCSLIDADGSDRVCLITPSGNTHFFQHANLDGTGGPEALIFGTDPTNAQPLISPEKFVVNRAAFAFSPENDPTDLTQPQMQPKVTIYLSVSPSNSLYQDIVIESQTTVSSRQY